MNASRPDIDESYPRASSALRLASTTRRSLSEEPPSSPRRTEAQTRPSAAPHATARRRTAPHAVAKPHRRRAVTVNAGAPPSSRCNPQRDSATPHHPQERPERPRMRRAQSVRLASSFQSGTAIATDRVLHPDATARSTRHHNSSPYRPRRESVIGQSLKHEHDRRRKAGFGTTGQRRFARHPFIVIFLVIVLGAGLFTVSDFLNSPRAATSSAPKEAPVDLPVLGPTVLPLSTPRAQWKQGSIPHLYQIDPAWAQAPYAGATVGTSGCGPTALTMVYVALTGKTDRTPAQMAAWAEKAGYAPTGVTEWALMSEGAQRLGLSSREVHPSRHDIEAALTQGELVIAAVRTGDFTVLGHFIVLGALDGRGNVGVFDPNSPFNSAHVWPINRVLEQTSACWALSSGKS